MHTPETDAGGPGLGESVKQVATHASALARLELELALLELKTKVAALGKGIGFGLGAAVFGLVALGYLLATLAAALDTFMPRWLALLIVALLLLAITGLLAMLALRAVKRGTPPVPQQAIDEAKATSEALKSNGTPA